MSHIFYCVYCFVFNRIEELNRCKEDHRTTLVEQRLCCWYAILKCENVKVKLKRIRTAWCSVEGWWTEGNSVEGAGFHVRGCATKMCIKPTVVCICAGDRPHIRKSDALWPWEGTSAKTHTLHSDRHQIVVPKKQSFCTACSQWPNPLQIQKLQFAIPTLLWRPKSSTNRHKSGSTIEASWYPRHVTSVHSEHAKLQDCIPSFLPSFIHSLIHSTIRSFVHSFETLQGIGKLSKANVQSS